MALGHRWDVPRLSEANVSFAHGIPIEWSQVSRVHITRKKRLSFHYGRLHLAEGCCVFLDWDRPRPQGKLNFLRLNGRKKRNASGHLCPFDQMGQLKWHLRFSSYCVPWRNGWVAGLHVVIFVDRHLQAWLTLPICKASRKVFVEGCAGPAVRLFLKHVGQWVSMYA